jgi:hypothetical protein
MVIWIFVKLGSAIYAAICCLPQMTIMCHDEIGFKDTFAHTTRHFLVEDVSFLLLGPLR